MNDHLETANEEHLRKTWSKLLKTTERLNELEAVEGQIEELQTDKESMKKLMDGNSEEISDLKLSAKKLEVENMALKKDLASLQKQLEEVKLIAADDKEEVRSLKAEYKALKKDLEELRCSKGYYAEEAEPKKTVDWRFEPESNRGKPAKKMCEEKQKECKKIERGAEKAEQRWAKRWVERNFSNKIVFNIQLNHKNYNFLACDWFKNVLFSTNSLAKLLSDSLLWDSLLLDSLLSDS